MTYEQRELDRYQRINAKVVFDTWTGKSIDVFGKIETE